MAPVHLEVIMLHKASLKDDGVSGGVGVGVGVGGLQLCDVTYQ